MSYGSSTASHHRGEWDRASLLELVGHLPIKHDAGQNILKTGTRGSNSTELSDSHYYLVDVRRYTK